MSRIVGISGCARSGKDTFLSVAKMTEPLIERVAFADLLKEELRERILEEFGLDSFSDVSEEKEKFRHLLVEHGKKRREEDPDYWLKEGMKRCENIKSQGLKPFISDVRYLNEAMEIVNSGGIIICLHRTGFESPNEEEKRSLKEVFEKDHKCFFDYDWDKDYFDAEGNLIATLEDVSSINSFIERCLQDSLIE